MRILRKILRLTGWTLGVLLLFLVVFCIYIYKVSDIKPPEVADKSALQKQVTHVDGSLYTIGNNWIRQNRWGLSEMYVEGAPFERGAVNGKLAHNQITAQEEAFTQQIKGMIPSTRYLKFLKYIVGFMNRALPEYVPAEYQQEIYGESFAASDSFNWIGKPYVRLLNYHAAHDIGHALRNLMLVGCTSFGAWGGKTANGSLLIGRNFDFWVGDKFAEHKIILFEKPDRGHRFMSVTWGGFIGVVSGMNDAGLTVTINAARSDIPYGGAATPVSLVAREVLQYAGNIEEALTIVHRRKMFVSESFLIGSSADRRAVVVEKTPDTLSVYDPQGDNILCTNHYQSRFYDKQDLNNRQKARSASVYRHARLQELMTGAYPLTPEKAAAILRDRGGRGGADIGNGNEKAVNQLIAHHSVIFEPDSLRAWVSTAPWQLGTYVCYDLRKIFALQGLSRDAELADTARNIAPDPFLKTPAYSDFLRFRANKLALLEHRAVDTAEVVNSNPMLYDAWRIAGDWCYSHKWYAAAAGYYKKALQKEIATADEREAIGKKLGKCETH